MKRRGHNQEPDTIVSPTRLPPVTIVVTKAMLLRKTCAREDWMDDGYVARCVRSPGHAGYCDYGVYVKASGYVQVTVARLPNGSTDADR
jgi:hypothetical protein